MRDDFLIDPEHEREIARRLGAELARRREAAGMTQEETAYLMRIGNQAVSRMERGAVMPSFKRVFEFAGLFGCRVDELALAASDREVDQEAALSHLLSGLHPSDRDNIVAIVKQLVQLVASAGRSGGPADRCVGGVDGIRGNRGNRGPGWRLRASAGPFLEPGPKRHRGRLFHWHGASGP